MYRPVLALVLLAVVIQSEAIMNPVEIRRRCETVRERLGSHFLRDPNDCNSMYNCDGDLSFPVRMNCGNNLVFSQSQQICVYRNSQYDDCGGKPIYAGRYNDPLCRRPNGANRDPTSCKRFILCWNGHSFPSMSCQGNLDFDVVEGRCVLPGSANC